MPIGNGPDIEQFDRKAEDLQRLYEKVDKWWFNLDYDYKVELMDEFYPGRTPLIGVDDRWNILEWKDKLDIYNESEEIGMKV